MRPTAPTKVRQRAVKDGDLAAWSKDEVIPSLLELRRAANYSSREATETTTDGAGTLATIWKSDVMPPLVIWQISGNIMGLSADGTIRAMYLLLGFFASDAAGAITQEGATAFLATMESDAACNADFAVTGSNIYLKVRDEGTTAMNYEAIVDWREYPHP